MKKLTSIISICLMAISISSCDDDNDSAPSVNQTPPDEPPCTIVCQNGGTVTPACNCECPDGYTGTYCQTKVITSVKVTVSPYYHQLVPAKYAGDNEFGGHIKIDGTVQLVTDYNNTRIYAVVNATYIESAGGMDTKARINGQVNTNRILLYTAPAGKKVYTINTNPLTDFHWYPNANYHGTGNYYPNTFVSRIEMIGDTSGDDLPSDGSTDRSRFRIWFNNFYISIVNS